MPNKLGHSLHKFRVSQSNGQPGEEAQDIPMECRRAQSATKWLSNVIFYPHLQKKTRKEKNLIVISDYYSKSIILSNKSSFSNIKGLRDYNRSKK